VFLERLLQPAQRHRGPDLDAAVGRHDEAVEFRHMRRGNEYGVVEVFEFGLDAHFGVPYDDLALWVGGAQGQEVDEGHRAVPRDTAPLHTEGLRLVPHQCGREDGLGRVVVGFAEERLGAAQLRRRRRHDQARIVVSASNSSALLALATTGGQSRVGTHILVTVDSERLCRVEDRAVALVVGSEIGVGGYARNGWGDEWVVVREEGGRRGRARRRVGGSRRYRGKNGGGCVWRECGRRMDGGGRRCGGKT
jgi:hypothetical protein